MVGIQIENFSNDASCNLNGCSIGKSFAQTLADFLGIPVSAFTGPTEFKNDNGNVIMVPSNPNDDKKTFQPTTK